MCAMNGQESPHTRAPLLFIAQHKPSRYVQLAHVLRTRGRSASYGRTVCRTSNGYKDRLKLASAVEKSQTWTIHPPRPDGPGPVNMKCESTDQFE
jgi:hypothetical protein